MKRVLQGLVLVLCLGLPRHAEAATYQVINTADTGAGSLRAAIDLVNANPGPHRIVFAILASGVQTIHLGSPLPEITNTVAIDGTTQPSYNQTPLIEVKGDASNLPFAIGAPNSKVMGLALNTFTDNCLYITADACTVSACFIGTNPAGTGTVPNGNAGIYVIGKRTLIGGRGPAFRNLLSGNSTGVYIDGTSEQDTVIGNYIGTDVTGRFALPNQQGIISGAPKVVIENNLVSGNSYNGIQTECGSALTPGDGTRIVRNWVGTDVTGTQKLANGENGVKLGCDYTVLGDIGRGNVISGNGFVGVYIDGAYSSYNQILGNYIGVSYDGALPLGNTNTGIYLPFSHNNMIGGNNTDGTGNVIGGNGGGGITIYQLSPDNTILGNAIGTSFNGALNLGNVGQGIGTNSDRTTIGGPGPLGNIIAHNAGGVFVNNSVQNAIRGNSIFENTFVLGIELSPVGVTPNDSSDADDGPNHLQNFPTISSVSQVSNQVRLQGALSSVPSGSFILDFYSNTTCNAQGNGEGETWLGSTNVITNGSGVASFDIQYPLSSVRGGYIFTATATDNGGSTSEFSLCAPLGSTPTAVESGPGLVFAMGASTPSPARGAISLPFTLPAPSHVTLRAYDVSGRLVAILVEDDRSAGPQRAEWSVDGVPAGTYFCKLHARASDGSGQQFEAARTVVVVR